MGGGLVKFSHPIRRIHRWVSIFFTVAVLANVVSLAVVQQDESAPWLGLLALLPLVALTCTGLYLFVLPYANRSRAEPSRVERMR